jgi:hypothetical protein
VKRLARWIGKTALAMLLIYFFAVIASALWLRQHLNSQEFARNPICWSRSASHINGPDKYRNRPWARDGLVIMTIHPGTGSAVSWIGWRLRSVVLEHVYAVYWPVAERRRLFEEVAALMRPCNFAARRRTD